MKDITGFLIIVVYAGIVFTLVRPGSQGPGLVKAAGSSITSVLQAGTGSGQKW